MVTLLAGELVWNIQQGQGYGRVAPLSCLCTLLCIDARSGVSCCTKQAEISNEQGNILCPGLVLE